MKKAILGVVSALAGAAVGAGAMSTKLGKMVEGERGMSSKHLALFEMMCQWVKVKQQGKNLSEYFEKNGYQKIAIYGMSFAGETLVNELRDTKITIVYGIDQNADELYADFDIYKPDDELPEVDAVVVTAIKFFDEIERKLGEKMECPIISLEDILYEI